MKSANSNHQALRSEMKTLWEESDAIWDSEQNEPAYELFVSADYELVFDTLIELRDKTESFLELGSGLGVITIMASRLGYNAFGIEAKSKLIDQSVELSLIHI